MGAELEQATANMGARTWQRQNCGTEGSFVTPDLESRAIMVDASPGGFKLRFEMGAEVTALLLPLPVSNLRQRRS